jgi:hypothetical protein
MYSLDVVLPLFLPALLQQFHQHATLNLRTSNTRSRQMSKSGIMAFKKDKQNKDLISPYPLNGEGGSTIYSLG